MVFGRFYANRLCAGAPGRFRCSRAIARSLCEGTANAQISASMHLMYQPGSKGAASVITRLLDALRGRATAQHLRLEHCVSYETLASGAAFPLRRRAVVVWGGRGGAVSAFTIDAARVQCKDSAFSAAANTSEAPAVILRAIATAMLRCILVLTVGGVVCSLHFRFGGRTVPRLAGSGSGSQ